MIGQELRELREADPFEPFRIKLVNGDVLDVFDPQTLSVHQATAWVLSPDQNWVVFPIDKINSIESLIADYKGELARHTQ